MTENLHQKGIEHATRGEFVEAEKCMREEIGKVVPSAPLFHDYGNVLAALNKLPQAIVAYEKAMKLAPDHGPIYCDIGLVLYRLGQMHLSLQCLSKALSLDDSDLRAKVARGDIFRTLGRRSESLRDYDQAIMLNNNCAAAWRGHGIIVMLEGKYEDAAASFAHAFDLDPDLPEIVGWLYLTKMLAADWSDMDKLQTLIRNRAGEGTLTSPPFASLIMPVTGEQQKKLISDWATKFPAPVPLWQGEAYDHHDKIRVAYLSSDFRDHTVGRVMAGVIEDHDKSKFEIICISLSNEEPQSQTRGRFIAAATHFVHAADMGDRQIALEIRKNEIDILVDLNGFTDGMRPYVMASRPAPVQINFLGFSGTMGVPYIDYIIADRSIVPLGSFSNYTESVLWMPHMMPPVDYPMTYMDRKEAGLPDDGTFVFCAFCNSYKITPQVFATWMRILAAVDNSVLWFNHQSPSVIKRLSHEAHVHLIDPLRLIFAPRVDSHADHMGRLSQADLVLDTFPYNGHTTVGEALSVDVPVLTMTGRTFAGRVATSLMTAIGRYGLVTPNQFSYESAAIQLGKDPTLVNDIKRRMKENRKIYPYYDRKEYVRELEMLYTKIKK